MLTLYDANASNGPQILLFPDRLSSLFQTEYAIKNFLLGVSLYPAVQARAREEIDRVVGNDRLPNFNDQDNLPYIHAIVLESLRWNPPIPFGQYLPS